MISIQLAHMLCLSWSLEGSCMRLFARGACFTFNGRCWSSFSQAHRVHGMVVRRWMMIVSPSVRRCPCLNCANTFNQHGFLVSQLDVWAMLDPIADQPLHLIQGRQLPLGIASASLICHAFWTAATSSGPNSVRKLGHLHCTSQAHPRRSW